MTGWRLSHSLEQLRAEVDAAHPGRSKVSDGTIGDPAHAARVSDHNPVNGIVHAWDVTDGPDHIAQAVVDFLLERRDPRVKYVIWQGRICSGPGQGFPAWVWRPYRGANRHDKHAHISDQSDNGAPWGYPGAKEAPVPLTDEDLEKIRAVVRDEQRTIIGWLMALAEGLGPAAGTGLRRITDKARHHASRLPRERG